MTDFTRELRAPARRLFVFALAAGGAAIAGCGSLPLPSYQASFVNQQSLSHLPPTATYRVDSIGEPSSVQSQIRAYRLTAPNGATWASYLRDGIRKELATSGNYAADADSAIKVTPLTVDVADGHAHVSARFVVETEGQVTYDKVLHADGRWRTSIVGAIAIPAASTGASVAFQNLLGQFFSDRDFVKTGSRVARRP